MSSSLSCTLPPPPPPPPPCPSDSPRHRHHFLPFPSAAATADLPSSARLLDPTAPTTSSYNTLIRSLSRSRDCKPLALRLYRRMLFDVAAAPPDNFTFPFVLKAAAFLSAFSEGTQIHAHILKLGFSSDTYVANSLIHFYASCGHQSIARKLFNRLLRRTRVSWNVTIDGYVANGNYDAALDLFSLKFPASSLLSAPPPPFLSRVLWIFSLKDRAPSLLPRLKKGSYESLPQLPLLSRAPPTPPHPIGSPLPYRYSLILGRDIDLSDTKTTILLGF